MADVSQIKLPNGSVYDLIDEKSGYITAEYIENKTDYEIPVSRVGEIVVGETAIGTNSTNFPTSKAVVDYVDERVVQEMDAIDVGVTSVNGKTGSVTLSASDVGAATESYVNNAVNDLGIPTSTSQLVNNSGFITASDVSTNETDPTVPAWAKASTKPTYTASEVGALPDSTVITDEKLKVNETSNNGTYYPILTSNSTDAQTKLRYGGLNYTIANNEASLKIGYASISTPRTGRLSLTKSNYFTTIEPSNNGHSNTITLPNKSGTVALLDDIPTVPTNISSFTNDSGYLTASDIASVMTYKGTKANYAALPSTGNTTGDVWHLTDTGAEWAWDGSAWQELGTAIDLSGYATKATTLAGYGITDAKIQNGTITLGSNTITPLTSFTETDPTVPSWAKASTKPTYTAAEVGALSDNTVIPSKTSDLTNDSGYLTSYTETDPTVPSWAKASSKPSYGLTEISGTDDLRAIEALIGTSGLLKKTATNTWTLDTNTYLTSYTETDPTVPSWAKQSSKPTYTAAEVGALPDSTTIPSKVSDLTNDSGFITSYTDEKLKVVGITSTTNTTYYPIVSTFTNDAETKLRSDNLKLTIYNASLCWLSIGNSGISRGRLRLYTTTSGGYTTLQSDATTNREVSLPDKGGTIALTSDIPSVYSSTNTGGYLTMATLPIYDGTVE